MSLCLMYGCARVHGVGAGAASYEKWVMAGQEEIERALDSGWTLVVEQRRMR